MSDQECRATSSREPSKFQPAKKNKISNYNKKQMLKMLKHANCHPKELNAMSKRFRVTDDNLIKSFINTQAFLSQTRLEQILKSKNDKHILNLDQCARNLTENGVLVTDNTLPVTLEAIANLEKHPPPAELNGIDLEALYKLLANTTAGYPIDDLDDGPTKEFLKQCYRVRRSGIIG
ncbi:uncharacterized protein LOC129578763 isoform X2 [Sitodiplosis mosellana]|uniref:uncharacterized protein LOC129578763 isoform X2 n=1 Tax=Sitodiplosis mosellana TaxID=263140 RepID=UPI0024453606|nr:uncharacterized protein LOC129578763 isoform X2 [Sitodiplosis mosellana]